MVIYLDQNKWIDIAKTINNPKKYCQYIDVVHIIKEKSNSGEWVFPTSLIHFIETSARADLKSRKNLASVMSLISKNNSIKPFVEIEKEEFINVFAMLHDVTKKVNICAVNKNLLSAIGADGVNVAFKREVPENIQKSIESLVETLSNHEDLFTMFMESNHDKQLIKDDNEDDQKSKEEWEKIQKYLKTLPKEHKYKICLVEGFLAQFKLHAEFLSVIFKKSKKELIPSAIMETPESTLNFLESIPSLNVQINLMYELLKNPERKVHLHDNKDVAFLATAIPYCDIVITEKTWKHAANIQNLHTKYSTIIENDLNFLMTI